MRWERARGDGGGGRASASEGRARDGLSAHRRLDRELLLQPRDRHVGAEGLLEQVLAVGAHEETLLELLLTLDQTDARAELDGLAAELEQRLALALQRDQLLLLRAVHPVQSLPRLPHRRRHILRLLRHRAPVDVAVLGDKLLRRQLDGERQLARLGDQPAQLRHRLGDGARALLELGEGVLRHEQPQPRRRALLARAQVVGLGGREQPRAQQPLVPRRHVALDPPLQRAEVDVVEDARVGVELALELQRELGLLERPPHADAQAQVAQPRVPRREVEHELVRRGFARRGRGVGGGERPGAVLFDARREVRRDRYGCSRARSGRAHRRP